jgi:casein kinase 1
VRYLSLSCPTLRGSPAQQSFDGHLAHIACSRRDDLESAALLLLHILTPGGLPWTRNGVPRDEAAHDRLKREKRAALPEILARDLPAEFEEFLRYCRGLGFTQQPNYAHWRGRFQELANDLGFKDANRFIWPPPPEPLVRFRSVLAAAEGQPSDVLFQTFDEQQQLPKHASKPRSHTSELGDPHIAGLLQGLAQMNINNRESLDRPVLGDRKNVQDNGHRPALLIKKPEAADFIVGLEGALSPGAGAGERGPGVHRYNKAARIAKLTQAAGQAADNRVLAQITADFVKVLQSSSSRTLTREGFAFLDALHKQLADPSVFIVPLRTSKTRTSRSQQELELELERSGHPAEEALRERRSRLNVLRTSLAKAEDNKTLAGLVAEFGTLIDKATGRKLTKDGMTFLECMADRLLVVRV